MNKAHAPATQRNREPILAVLRELLPKGGTVLEIASGSGEHAAHFAPALAPRLWQPSDIGADNLASIAAWSAERPCDSLLPPLRLDVTETPWPVETDPPAEPIRAIVAINLIHIAPPEATNGLFSGAERVLPQGGMLLLYGPFRLEGRHTAPSNASFDGWLRGLDPRYGVRDLGEVVKKAADCSLVFERSIDMPANNLTVIFRQRR